ncbi:hypothetical protein SANA_31660 [Gottschalkiaceae bacterium SANA]|nr:hypothetical protein SANA_31660 [Gottschalkiaceae bacterium SANA]
MSFWNNKFNYITILMTLLIFVFGPVPVYADSDTYEVESIAIRALVDREHCIQVTEQVQMMFYKENGDITRTIPLRVDDQYFEIDQIQGQGLEIEPVYKRDQVVLRIKKESGDFSGLEKLDLQYVLRGSQDDDPDRDLLTLSVIAPDWHTYINHVHISIELPVQVPSEMVTIHSTIGEVSGRDPIQLTMKNNQVFGRSKYFLVPGEVLTMSIQLPEGTFSDAILIRNFYEDTKSWAYSITIGIFLMAFGWWVWLKEKLKEGVIRKEPPWNASPSEIGYLLSNHVETRDLSIMLIEWANRGWIHIYPKYPLGNGEKGATLILKRKPPMDMPAYENRFFHLLFDEYGDGSSLRIENLRGRFPRHLDEIKAHLMLQYGSGNQAFYKIHQTKDIIALSILASLPILFFWIRVALGNHWGWTGLVVAVCFTLVEAIAIRWVEIEASVKKRMIGVVGLGLLAIFSIYLDRGMGFFMALASAGLINFLIKHSEKRSLFGLVRLRKYQGYKKFLQGVQKEELLVMIQQAPDLFYYGLPYAERLGVLNEWKKPFKEIFLLPPIWYHGEESNAFSIEEFTQEILTFLTYFEEVLESDDL